MDAEQVRELLADVLDETSMGGELPEVDRVRTFEEAGVLTTNARLVLTIADDSEYQVEIVRSR